MLGTKLSFSLDCCRIYVKGFLVLGITVVTVQSWVYAQGLLMLGIKIVIPSELLDIKGVKIYSQWTAVESLLNISWVIVLVEVLMNLCSMFLRGVRILLCSIRGWSASAIFPSTDGPHPQILSPFPSADNPHPHPHFSFCKCVIRPDT